MPYLRPFWHFIVEKYLHQKMVYLTIAKFFAIVLQYNSKLRIEHQHQRMLCYSILPFEKVTLLLIPYHFTIPPTSKNSIFIKILFFNISLLFISNRFFQIGVIESHFPWLSQQSFFFISFSLNL